MPILKKIQVFFKQQSLTFYIFLGISFLILCVQAILEYGPSWQESRRLSHQKSLFQDYWEQEGAAKFQAVGLSPTNELYNEELNAYLDKYKEKNPSLVPEKRIQEMKIEFREWWETGGSKSFAVQNMVPDKKLYQKEETKLIKSYTDTKLIYMLKLNTNEPEISQVLFQWLLFPNLWIFLLQSISLLFVANFIENRFGKCIGILLLFASQILGNVFLLGLSQTSFFANNNESYVGLAFGIAFILGCICRNYAGKMAEKTILIPASILLLFGLLLYWFTCSKIYVAVIILSIVFFIGGTFAGKYIPFPKKSKKESEREKKLEKANAPKQNFAEQKKKNTRAKLDEGFSCAMRGDFTLAGKYLGEAMHSLLLEADVDQETITDIAKKIVNPSLYIEISSIQWLEWGTSAYQKKLYEAAILFLEKSLVSEKDERMARKALFLIGEIRVSQSMIPEEGIKRLEKVIELNNTDIFAIQAKKIIQKFNSTN